MENQETPKSTYWKFVGAFIVIILVVVAGFVAWKAYEIARDRNAVKDAAEALEQAGQEAYARAMADTYGGTTPQETLAMYIDAVEKGDYELASKYFVGDYQAKELESFKNSKPENIEYMLEILRSVKLIDLRANLAEMYDKENEEKKLSESKEDYINRLYQVWDYDEKAWMDTKVDGYDFSVSFKKYPNGVWKIIDF